MFTLLGTSAFTTVMAAAAAGISPSMVPNAAFLAGTLTAHVVFMLPGRRHNLHRHHHIEGLCNNIHKGKVRVGF